MSQLDSINEDEVRSYINKRFRIQLARDAFLRPTSDIVTEIYIKFLDNTGIHWRRSPLTDEFFERTMKTLMTGWLRRIFFKFDQETTFGRSDITVPTKRRTNIFMSLVVRITKDLDERADNWQQWKEEHAFQQQSVEVYHKELTRKQLEQEELKYKLSQARPIEELRQLGEDKTAIFNEKKSICDRLAEERAEIKERITALYEQNQSIDLESLNQEISNKQDILRSLNEFPQLRDKHKSLEKMIADGLEKKDRLEEEKQRVNKEKEEIEKVLRQLDDNLRGFSDDVKSTNTLFSNIKMERTDIQAKIAEINSASTKLRSEEKKLQEQLSEVEQIQQKIRVQNQIKIERVQADKLKSEAIKNDLVHRHSMKVATLKADLKALEEKRAEILASRTRSSEETNNRIEQATRQLDSLRKLAQEFDRKSDLEKQKVRDNQTRIQRLIGRPKEIELPADRTYIKESGVNKS